MRAAVVPSVNGKWEVRDVPQPEAGTDQVLIKIHASGICYTDVHETAGHIPGTFPRIMGHEPVGEIVAVGPGVTTRKVGDRVGVPWIQTTCRCCEWCRRGKQMFCADGKVTGIHMQGGHAEFMPAYADATMVLPEDLSYEQAAPLFCAGYTVWSGLRWAEPQPGERVAVVGIGGLGHLAVQYAKAAGFETIAISHSPDKDKLIRELGADEIVRDGKGLARAGGADIVLGTSNSSEAMADTLQGLRPDGRLVIMGAGATAMPVSPTHLLSRRIRIIGSTQNGAPFLHEALEIAAKGKVKVIEETYSLQDIGRAYERVEKGQVRFRAVVVN
ncbi:MAG: alcohol dehydrogenase catalytic domain-containing protein [Acidipila sp.]|nr:alcohol dehydrogenase catalytic domain-containing protein [Acidipila sp.]